jgi:two-component system alkaline phosphatase synthesis response regulator PhoP
MSARILLVEDEPGLVLTLTDRLLNEGYEVESARDGEAGLQRARDGGHDLILLDVMLPRKSGFDVCRELRHAGSRVPVLMLTARGQVVDKVVGLQIGADDYMVKPFDMAELLARITALLRRAATASVYPPREENGVHEFGDIKVDVRRGEVRKSGQAVVMSAREFQLLRYLIERPGAVITRETLLHEVWGYQATPSTRTVDVHMAWLRQKLENNPKLPEYFLTLRGMGYKFVG